MNLTRQIVVCSALVLGIVPQQVKAQNGQGSGAPRWAIGASFDVGGVPDELGMQCGFAGGTPVLGGGASVLFHSRPWLVIETDTRASAIPPVFGCPLNLPAPVQVGPNAWAGPIARDLRHAPTPPLLRSALRLGVETPADSPLFRATIGGGFLWTNHTAPFGTATVGVGSRGRYVRFYTEFEASVCRIRVMDTQLFFHTDSVGTVVPDSRKTTPVVLHPQWGMLHVGLEFPIGFN